MHEFFDQDHLETLSKQFPNMNQSDIYLRTYPYKFGVYCIFLDEQGKSAQTYHTAFKTRAAFELIKRLAELAYPELMFSESGPGSQPPLILSAVEKEYLKVQLGAAVNAPDNDLAAVLTEINALLAFHATVDKVEIGDGLNRPDVRLNDIEREYDVQCKSLGLSKDETDEVSGMYYVAQAVHRRLLDLKGLTSFSCWHIKTGQLAHADGISQAIAMVNMFIDYSSGKALFFPRCSPALDLVCHTGSGNESFSDFLGRALPIETNGRRFAPFIPEIVAEFATPTLSSVFVFVSFRNVRKLAKRARLRFNEAMKQHEEMRSRWPIVFLNIESPHELIRILQPAAADAPLPDALVSAVKHYHSAIASFLRRSRRWKDCKGLVLTSTVTPLVTLGGGVSWRRITSFSTQQGMTEAEAFPPFAKMRARFEGRASG